MPLSLSGAIGPAAKATLAEIDELRAVAEPAGIDVVAYDERLTTVTAERALNEARMRREARRRVVDKVAAAVMLQSWLDGGARAWERVRSSGEPARAASMTQSSRRTAYVVIGLVIVPLIVLAIGAVWF